VAEPDASFGVVTAYGLLQHLHDYLPVFKEAYRCLAAGGFFYADESQNFYCAMGLAELGTRTDLDPLLADEVALVVSDSRRYGVNFGLDVETVETAMFQGKTREGAGGGVGRCALRAAGFRNVAVGYRWFLGRSPIQRELAEPLARSVRGPAPRPARRSSSTSPSSRRSRSGNDRGHLPEARKTRSAICASAGSQQLPCSSRHSCFCSPCQKGVSRDRSSTPRADSEGGLRLRDEEVPIDENTVRHQL
jgi:hypothetical protein